MRQPAQASAACAIQTRLFVERERVVRTARFQHGNEALARAGLFVLNRIGEGRRARHRGGILIDIEAVIEVRDEGPLTQ